jgi:tetratricopeptide (TPR) repeat protein
MPEKGKAVTDKFQTALKFEQEGKYRDAMDIYISIAKEDPACKEAYINLGSIFSRMNRFDNAMAFYKRALKIRSDYITLFNIGCIFYKMNQYKKAVINLEKSRSMKDNFNLSSLVIGLCYSRMNNYKAAETNFINVLKITPDNRVALTALAILYYNQDKLDKSLYIINRLIKQDSTNIKIKELRSNVLYKKGKFDESVEEIKSLKKISNGYMFYDEFIKSVPVETYTDKYGTINEKIDYLMENGTSDKNSLISLSLCYLLKGDTDLALDYLFKVKKQFNR